MKRMKAQIIAGIFLISAVKLAQALPSPGAEPNISSWQATAIQILPVSARNSSNPAQPNPQGTVYFFGASVQARGQVNNGSFIPDGHGNVVISNIGIPNESSTSTPSDVILGRVSPLLAETSYYTYAQACPPAVDAQHPRLPNSTGCSAWTQLNDQPIRTTKIGNPQFDRVRPRDVSPSSVRIPAFTTHAAPQTDVENIVFWRVRLTDCTQKDSNHNCLGPISPIISSASARQTFTISHNEWNGLMPNSTYRLEQWFEFPYLQTSLTSITTFYTAPATAKFEPGDGIIDIGASSVTVRFRNSVDPDFPNPKGARFLVETWVDGHFSETMKYTAVNSATGVSTETFVVTVNDLMPGTTYGAYIIPHFSDHSQTDEDGETWSYPVQGVPPDLPERADHHFVTLGTKAPPFDDEFFQAITPRDVNYHGFIAKTKIQYTPENINKIAAWHMDLKNVFSNISTHLVLPPSDFVMQQSSICVMVSTRTWPELMSNSPYVVKEYLEYRDGTRSHAPDELATPPTFYLQAHPAGWDVNPIISRTDHSFNIRLYNSSDPKYPNPKRTLYRISAFDPESKVERSAYVHAQSSVSNEPMEVITSGLTPNTTYQLKIYVYNYLESSPWPGFGPVLMTTTQTTPPDKIVTADPGTVSSSGARVALEDVQNSTSITHFIVRYASKVDRQPWTKDATQMSYALTDLQPNTPYTVRAQTCISPDNSQCFDLREAQFTTKPADVEDNGIVPHATDLVIRWHDDMTPHGTNPNGTAYDIRVCPPSGSCFNVVGSTKTHGETDHSFTMTGLTEGTTYQVMVRGRNSGGSPWPEGDWLRFDPIRTPPASDLRVLDAVFDVNGFPLDNTKVCVPSEARLQVTFNREIDIQNLQTDILIEHQAYAFHGVVQVLSGVRFSTASVNGKCVLTMTPPPGGWPDGDPMRITLKTTLHDNYPTYLSQPYVVSFVPVKDVSRARRIMSFVDKESPASLQMEEQSSNACVVLRTQFLSPANALAADLSKAVDPTLLKGLRNTAQEVLAVSLTSVERTNDSFNKPMILRIPLPPNASPISDNPATVPVNWVMAWLNPQTLKLEIVEDSVLEGGIMHAPIKQPGVYMIAQGSQSTDISNAYAYPVPYRVTMPVSGITFTNLGAGCRIRVYTPSGLKIKEIDVPLGEVEHLWNLKNGEDRIASGVYLYIIESPAGKKKGKLIIIQ